MGLQNEVVFFDAVLMTEISRMRLSANGDRKAAGDEPMAMMMSTSPNGNYLAVSADAQHVAIYSVLGNSLVRTLIPSNGSPLNKVQWSPDGQYLLISLQNHAELWNLNGNYCGSTVPLHEMAMVSSRFAPSGRRFATFGADGFVHVFEVPSAKLIASLRPGSTFVDGSFSYEDDLILISSNEEEPTIWSVAKGVSLGSLDSGHASFSPSGRQILTISNSLSLHEFRLEDRPPAELKAVIDNRVPWRVKADALFPVSANQR